MKSIFYMVLFFISSMNVLIAQKRVTIDKVNLKESEIILTPDSVEKFYKEIAYNNHIIKGKDYLEVLCDEHVRASYLFEKNFIELVIYEDTLVRKLKIPKPIDEWDLKYYPTEQLSYFNLYSIKEICFQLQNWHQIYNKLYFLKIKFKETQKQLDKDGLAFAYRIEKERKDTSLIIDKNFKLASSCKFVDTLRNKDVDDFLDNFRENLINIDEREISDEPCLCGDGISGGGALDAILFYNKKQQPIGFLGLDMIYNVAFFYFKKDKIYQYYTILDYGTELKHTIYRDLNYRVTMKLMLRKVNNLLLNKMDLMEYRLLEDERDKRKKY